MQILSPTKLAQWYKTVPKSLLNADTYERIVQSLYTHTLLPTSAAIDCGGNKGQHTFSIAKCCRRVYCFEPIPELANRLCVRAETAGYREKILVFPCAVEKDRAHRSFKKVVGAEALSSFSPQLTKHEHLEIEVPVVRLDDIVSEQVDFIKLDIEGAEFGALQGAERILKQFRPPFAFEFSREHTAERFGYTESEFFTYFDKVGYYICDIFGNKLSGDMWSKNFSLPWYSIGWPIERSSECMLNAIASVCAQQGFRL